LAPAALEPDDSTVVFEGPVFQVEVERWGERRRDVVRHPGACAGLVMVEGDRVVLVRQLREAVRRPLLEIPAGLYDVQGERPADAMRREIAEETGYRATAVEPLGHLLTAPGFSDERIDLFLCAAEPAGEPAELDIEVVVMPFDRAVHMVEDRTIEDAKSAVALLLAARLRLG
jgi:ADP-ribose pyrophosphatase